MNEEEEPKWLVQAVGKMPETVEEAYPVAANVTPAARALYALRDRLYEWIGRDMAEREATERVVDGVTYSFQSEGEWSVPDEFGFLEALAKLMEEEEITSEQLAAAVSVEEKTVHLVRFDHRYLNSLSNKRGEKVRAVIKHFRIRKGKPTLRIKE
jgi:hypothetical protein